MFLAESWGWWALACVLVMFELLTLSFTFLFFALSAALVGVLAYFGFKDVPVLLSIFGAVGLLGLLGLRGPLKRKASFRKNSWDEGSDIHKELELSSDLPARGHGTIEYQGTTWTVVNDSDLALSAGSKVKIVRIDGVKLLVKK
jgi:membrane protein implicated in regulation of membrane protease activity